MDRGRCGVWPSLQRAIHKLASGERSCQGKDWGEGCVAQSLSTGGEDAAIIRRRGCLRYDRREGQRFRLPTAFKIASSLLGSSMISPGVLRVVVAVAVSDWPSERFPVRKSDGRSDSSGTNAESVFIGCGIISNSYAGHCKTPFFAFFEKAHGRSDIQ